MKSLLHIRVHAVTVLVLLCSLLPRAGGQSLQLVGVPSNVTASCGHLPQPASVTAMSSCASGVSGASLYYSFDVSNAVTVADDSGNGHTGTVAGARWTTLGRFGGAYDFDGSSHIRVGNVFNLDNVRTAITVGAWVRLPTNAGGSEMTFVAKLQSGSPYTGWGLRSYHTNVMAELEAIWPQRAVAQSKGSNICDGAWHHVCGIFEASSNGVLRSRIYFDGAFHAQDEWTNAHGTTATSAELWLGARAPGMVATLRGTLDEVRIYERRLGESEIATLANTSPPSAPGPSLYYSFDASNATIVVDDSGNGYAGTVEGATWTPSGRMGGAYYFNGSSRIRVGNFFGLTGACTALTASAWVKLPPNTSGLEMLFIDKMQAEYPYTGWSLRSFHTNVMAELEAIWPQRAVSQSKGPSICDDAWHHVCGVFEASSDGIMRSRVYLDGAYHAQDEWTNAHGTTATSTELWLGGRYPNTVAALRGLLDEVRIYERRLSDAEIAILGTGQTGGAQVTVNRTETTNGACPKVISRVWTATDGCGSSVSATQTITMVDNEAPVLVGVPADMTVTCGQFLPIHPEVIGVDDCGNVPVSFDAVTNGSCPATVARTWTAMDGCGNSTSATQLITMQPASPPVLIGVPSDTIVSCGQVPPPASVTATGACIHTGLSGASLYYSFDSSNATVVADDSGHGYTGTVVGATWTAAGRSGGAYSFNGSGQIRVANVLDLAGSRTAITVSAWVNLPPDTAGDEMTFVAKLHSAYPYTGWGLRSYHTNVLAEVEAVWPQRAVAQSKGINICDGVWHHVCAVFETTTSGPMRSRVYLDGSFHAQDEWTSSHGATETSSQLWLGGRSPSGGMALRGRLDEVRIYERRLNDSEIAVLAEGQIDFVETVHGACPRTISRVWTATDTCGNSVSATQTITMIDSEAPILVGVPADITISCGQPLPLLPDVIGVDDCGEVPVSLSAVTNGSCPATIARTWTAIDGCGNSASATQVVTVLPASPPVLVGVPSDITVSCGQVPPPTVVTATGSCMQAGISGASLYYSFDSSNTTVVTDDSGNGYWGTVEGATWTIAGRSGGAYSFSGTNRIRVGNAFDLAGSRTTMTVSAWVNLPPDAAGLEMTFVAKLHSAYPYTGWGIRSYHTNVLAEVEATWPQRAVSQSKGPNICDGAWHHVCGVFEASSNGPMRSRVYLDGVFHAEDEWSGTHGTTMTSSELWLGGRSPSGGMALRGRLDEVRIYERPLGGSEIKALADVQTGIGQIPVAMVEITNGTCPKVITRVWTATDECGHIIDATQTITVVDSEAPILVGVPPGITICCSQPIPPVADVIAIDDCGPIPVTINVVTNGSCPGTIMRTWSAVDSCGNATSALQVVTLRAPVDHFVSTNGANMAPYTDWATAARSVQDAIDVCEDGDRVWVAPGTYREVLDIGGRAIEISSLHRVQNDASLIDATVIDGAHTGRVVTFKRGETAATLLSGFTLVNGSSVQPGGGLACIGSSPRLEDLVLAGNTSAGDGGGIYLSHSHAALRNVTLAGNRAASGGGLRVSGGLPRLSNIRAVGNIAAVNAGAVCLDHASPCIENLLASGNHAAGMGGAIFLSEAKPLLVNATLAGNHSASGGGGAIGVSFGAQPEFVNGIVHANTEPQIIFDPQWNCMSLAIGHSDVVGGAATINTYGRGPVFWLAGNIDADPLLNIGLYPSSDSPCIDAGTNQAWMAGATDIGGGHRIVGMAVDMGAFEFTTNHIPGYLAAVTCTIEPADVLPLGAAWQVTSGGVTGWLESAETVRVPAGPVHIEFLAVAGWNSPAPIDLLAVTGSNTALSAAYSPQVLDNIAPTIVHIAPPDGHVSAGNQIPMTIIATDNTAIAHVTVNGQSATLNGSHTYHFTAEGVRGEFNEFVVEAVDLVGNTTSQTVHYGNSRGIELRALWNGFWQVRNPETNDISFVWSVKNDPSEVGAGLAPANGTTYFGTTEGPKIVVIYVNGVAVAQAPWSPAAPRFDLVDFRILDSDMDGKSNYDEELAGSSSQDASSVLALGLAEAGSSSPASTLGLLEANPLTSTAALTVFSWFGNSDNVYTIESSTNLSTWTVVPDCNGVPGGDALMSFTNDIPAGDAYYIRLRAGKRQ